MPLANSHNLGLKVAKMMDDKSYNDLITTMLLDINKLYFNDIQRKRLHDYLKSEVAQLDPDEKRSSTQLHNTEMLNEALNVSIGPITKEKINAMEEWLDKCYGMNRYIETIKILACETDNLKVEMQHLDFSLIQPDYLGKFVETTESLIKERNDKVQQLKDKHIAISKMSEEIVNNHNQDCRKFDRQKYRPMLQAAREFYNLIDEVNQIADNIAHIGHRIGLADFGGQIKDINFQDRVCNVIAQSACTRYANAVNFTYPSNVRISSSLSTDHIHLLVTDTSFCSIGLSTMQTSYHQTISDIDQDWKIALVKSANIYLSSKIIDVVGEDAYLPYTTESYINCVDAIVKNWTNTKMLRQNVTDIINNIIKGGYVKNLEIVLPKIDMANVKIANIVHNAYISLKEDMGLLNKTLAIILANMIKKPTPKDCEFLMKIVTDLPNDALGQTGGQLISQICNYKAPRKRKASPKST